MANPCASNPCANGGQCSAFDSTYICTCPPAFHGQTCKQDVNECAQTPSPCLNGGVCVNEVGSYHCRCASEYTGQHCETPYMPCSPSPCQNGGTCIQKGDTTYDCTCLPGNVWISPCWRLSHWKPILFNNTIGCAKKLHVVVKSEFWLEWVNSKSHPYSACQGALAGCSQRDVSFW